MLLRRRLRFIVRKFAPPIYWVCLVAGISIPLTWKADIEWIKEISPQLEWTVKALRSTAFLTVPICMIFCTLCPWLTKKARTTEVEKIVKGILDKFEREAISMACTSDNQRVTLFKHVTWVYWPAAWMFPFKWPWGGWLIPYQRAGQFNLNTGINFYAPKSRPQLNEGVVGNMFKSQATSYINNLQGLDKKSSDEDIAKYAKKTNTTEKLVRRKVTKDGRMPRAFWGIPIEIRGEKWGVLMIDCYSENIHGHQNFGELFRRYGICLEVVLTEEMS